MDDLDKALKKIRTVDLSDFPNVDTLDNPMEAGLWALWVLQDKFEFHEQHFPAAILEQVLLRKGVSFYEKELERSFTRARRNIHKTNDVTGKNAFMITEKGKNRLRDLVGEENVEVIFIEGQKHRTAFKKFSEIIKKTNGKIMIVDKFYSRQSLDTIEEFGKTRTVEFLTSTLSNAENKTSFNKEFSRFRREFKNVKIRIFPKEYELHDRYIVTNDTLILLGRGIQDIGEKESFIIVLKDKVGKEIRKLVLSKFNERWNKSSNLK